MEQKYLNPKLISWDYGKEITLTLEDALLSMESLRMLMGGKLADASEAKKVTVRRTAQFTATSNGLPASIEDDYGTTVTGSDISEYKWMNLTKGTRGQCTGTLEAGSIASGDTVRIFWDEERDGANDNGAVQVTISPSTFPGSYKIYGDTFIRNENGMDSPFQFVIGKAKVKSEVTLTLEAEGDPSTFNMTIDVLRSGNNEMMSLIKYE